MNKIKKVTQEMKVGQRIESLVTNDFFRKGKKYWINKSTYVNHKDFDEVQVVDDNGDDHILSGKYLEQKFKLVKK